jgi:hypothetical protein
MRCIFCGKSADLVESDWDGTKTRCVSGHKVRFPSVLPDRVAALNDEQRHEMARDARPLPDGSFEVWRDRFTSIEKTY